MKKILLITLCLSIYLNAISQTITTQIKLIPDSFDIGITKSIVLGYYDLYQKHRTIFKKCYREPYSYKDVKIQNPTEIAYIHLCPISPSYPFICKIEIVKNLEKGSRSYCVSLNTKENFTTNKFTLRIGDSYSSVINRLYNIPYDIDTTNNKIVLKITRKLNAKGRIFEGDVSYEAQYIFIKNKLDSYTLSIL